MKKLMVLAMMATLLTAGSAFAVERHFGATPNATFSFGAPGTLGPGPTTTNNDDTCDISVAPAATLLLPVFEVDTTRAGGENTLFTVTNVSRYPQIAHVTVWTEWSFPVLDFNLFLTGYDTQSLSMYDVIVGGTIAGSGTSSDTDEGALSALNTANPNLAAGLTGCDSLPGQLPGTLVTEVQNALTVGTYSTCGTAKVGGSHAGIARGYVTVDVTSACTGTLPTTSSYYASEILFDNVLIGDYEQLGAAPVGGTATGFNGGGTPMVHIRAVPEGGPAGSAPGTNLPFTFYDRYTGGTGGPATRTFDRRQPLPSTFAARFIESAANGFSTNYRIWREGRDNGGCSTVASSSGGNSNIPIAEIVRFDEDENPYTAGGGIICSPVALCGTPGATLPEASITATTNRSVYPQFPSTSTAVGGWMYLNLNNGGSSTYSTTHFTGGTTGALVAGEALPVGVSAAIGNRPSQNWVTIEMFGTIGSNRLAAMFDAAWLGNGCSAGAKPAVVGGTGTIGPAGGVLVCPAGVTCTGAAYTGTNTTPLP